MAENTGRMDLRSPEVSRLFPDPDGARFLKVLPTYVTYPALRFPHKLTSFRAKSGQLRNEPVKEEFYGSGQPIPL
jgi:hypothetical protein